MTSLTCAGEDMRSTYIITKTRVELLVVPRLLFTRTLRWRQLDKMRLEAESHLTSNHDLLTLYAHKRDWEIHKVTFSNPVVRVLSPVYVRGSDWLLRNQFQTVTKYKSCIMDVINDWPVRKWIKLLA
jgi:hypothetical protein